MRGVLLTLALVLTSTLVMARSYFLPDYQGAGLERRIQDTDKQNNITTCSPYGLYNSIQSGMTCSVVYPVSGLTCYTCSCDSVYKYSSADCPTPPYILSDQCKGKYKSCSCDTTLYPTTSATGGCQYGFIPDINNYCDDKPDGTKHYACVKPVCKPDNITVEDCQAQGDGHNCTASKEANCTDYCDTNGCQDNCAYLTQTGQARSDCRYGCAVGKDVSGCSGLCYECAAAPGAPTNTCVDVYDGKSNTATIINQLGADALAATAANQFYVGDKNGDFGQGKWYLPSIGELVDMYGVDSSKVTQGYSNTGALGGYQKRINTALETLEDKGAEAEVMSFYLWSSSESQQYVSWRLGLSGGNRSVGNKDESYFVRPCQLLENCFNPAPNSTPKIGDVMYADKTWGSADDYDWIKQAVGIVSAVGNDGSVKIISLKNLTFSSTGGVGNFNPDDPYGGTKQVTQWATKDKARVNVIGVPDYSYNQFIPMLKKCATDEKLCLGPTIAECEAYGAGYRCVASTEEGCSDYCASECMDMCRYEQVVNNAVSNCQYGCAVGKEVSGCPDLCYECEGESESPTNTCVDIYDGKSNTTAIISQLGADALVATAANQYYVGDKNGDFGQGKWYLPSIGELVDMYGVDLSKITNGSGKNGAIGGYLREINYVLTTLYDKGVDTDILSDTYWSSSEHSADRVWKLMVSSANGSGLRFYILKDYSDHTYVRAFLEIEKCFATGYAPYPKVGHVLYDDKTWGNVRDYYSGSSKKPVGIIASVNKTDGSVKIVSLKNLTFSSIESSGNFDADNPYGGKYEESVWAPYDKREVNVTAVPNYSSDKLKAMLKACAPNTSCPFINAELSAIFDGKSNTKAAVNQLGKEALAAWAADNFYVGDKNGAFGQGQWYLPAIGEWIDFYGTDVSEMTDGYKESGAVGDNKAKINSALTTLKKKRADANVLDNEEYYWSSSEISNSTSWSIFLRWGSRNSGSKGYDSRYVRPFQLLENCFDPTSGSTPKIGDVMYADKTWGSANDYDGSKQAVGIVSTVGNDGSVKIISLKDLTFSSEGSVGNFNPDKPYGGSGRFTQWATKDKSDEDVVDITNYEGKSLLAAFKHCRE